MCSTCGLVIAAMIALSCRLPRGKNAFDEAGSCQAHDDDNDGNANFPGE